jgi:hypothetical protein
MPEAFMDWIEVGATAIAKPHVLMLPQTLFIGRLSRASSARPHRALWAVAW